MSILGILVGFPSGVAAGSVTFFEYGAASVKL